MIFTHRIISFCHSARVWRTDGQMSTFICTHRRRSDWNSGGTHGRTYY